MGYSTNNMDICESGHDRIVHAERHCPLCALKEENEDTIASLTEDLKVTKEQLEAAETELERVRDTMTWVFGPSRAAEIKEEGICKS